MDVARTRLFRDTGTPDWAENFTQRSPEEAWASVWKSAWGKRASNVEAPFILSIFTLVASAGSTSVTDIELSTTPIMITMKISCVSIFKVISEISDTISSWLLRTLEVLITVNGATHKKVGSIYNSPVSLFCDYNTYLIKWFFIYCIKYNLLLYFSNMGHSVSYESTAQNKCFFNFLQTALNSSTINDMW